MKDSLKLLEKVMFVNASCFFVNNVFFCHVIFIVLETERLLFLELRVLNRSSISVFLRTV